MPKEKRYRLRIDKKIVGYRRDVSPRMTFYSANEFWWNGQPIAHKQVDEWTGWRDKNRRHIYEWDIIYFKLDPDDELSRKGVVLWNIQDEEFGIKILGDSGFVPMEVNGIQLFKTEQIEVFSYLFLNPDIADELGLEDV